jgi:transcriptional regulator with PAS, ATPase and Fis domain
MEGLRTMTVSSPFLGLGSEEALRELAGALFDGVFTTDAEGRITSWNEAAQRITGWTEQEALGAECSLLAGDTVNGCMCGGGPIRCGLAMSGRSVKQCTTRTKDGRLLRIVKSAIPLRGPDGAHVGALESFTPLGPEPARRGVERSGLSRLVGRHAAMLELFRTIELVATSSATVMIRGESGTGKDLVAEAIHALGPRAQRPFVRVRCSALDELLASDGSAAPREGNPLDAARGGTLVLDDIGDLSATGQLRLLQFLERLEAGRSATPPCGACEPRDVRVLCTMRDDVRRAVEEGRFRADLYFRLNVFPVRVPPLRERVDDVPLLAAHLLELRGSGARLGSPVTCALLAHRWPGNVRELANVLDYALLRCAGDEIGPEHLPQEVKAPARPAACPGDERAELAEALARCGGSRTLAARFLGISRVTLWKRLKKHGVL